MKRKKLEQKNKIGIAFFEYLFYNKLKLGTFKLVKTDYMSSKKSKEKHINWED